MDVTEGNTEDDSKYAFLLGSALRNDDSEQLLTIYDSLIPKSISNLRLQSIKEGARQVSELPDHEFNQLVINARTFSLAPGRSSMNQYNRRSTTPPSNLLQNDMSSSCVGNSTELNQTSPILLHSSSPKLSKSFQDEDSGLASCQFSESLGGEASEEDRMVSDEALLHCQTNHVRITPTFNPPYDEEVKIDSSTGDSSIESPRSETSVTHDEYNLMDEGTEMETLSYKETPQICESLPPRQSISSRSNHERDCWDYMPQNNVKEASEDECDDHQPYQKQPVDKSINIQQYVRIEKDQPLYNGTRYMFDDSIRLGIHKDPQDAVEHQSYGLLDVNGNPKPKDLTSYQQLRKSPGGAESGALGTILSGSTRCALSSTEGTRERKRRAKKDPVVLAETVSDYKGDLPLEDILCFINGNGADKDLPKETPTSNGLSKVETKTKKKQERNNKKEKHDEGKVQTNAVQISSESITVSCATGSKESVVTINEGSNNISDLRTDDSQVFKSNHLGEHSNLGNKKITDCSGLKASKPDNESDSKMINLISQNDQVKIDVIKDGLLDLTSVSHGEVRSVGNSSVHATVVTPSSHADVDSTPDLKREESFTEVKKKKKRVGGNNLVNNTVSSHTRNFNSNVTVYRNHLRQKPSGPLVSGNLATNAHSLVVNDQPHVQRDLSPSSFPSLSGTGQRRNSCGEFDTDAMENRNLYDSDRESVKSLPVTHGGRPSCETYPVSYATMVAAPPRYESNTSPSSESGVASGSQNSSVDSNIMQTPSGSMVIAQPFPNPNSTPERKPTVWKGSPRERRHSIGSSPEDKAEIESISQRNRQKSGSQEIFTRDIHLENTNNEASEGGEICECDNPASSHLLDEEVMKPVKIVSETNHLATETFVISPLPSNVCQVSSSATRELGSTNIPQPSKPLQSSCDKMGLEQKVVKSKVEQPALHPVSSATKVTGRAGRNQHVSLIVDTTKKCNSNSGNNTKSVVFLDKRFSHCPQDLGITFGFDLESTPNLTSPVMSHSQPTSDITTIPITSAVTSSQLFSHIPPLSGAENKSDLCVSSISNKSLVHKDPHLEGHCNGLILPCTAGHQSIVVNSCDHRTNAQVLQVEPLSNDGVSQQIVAPLTNISTCTSKVNSGKSAPNQNSGSASVGLIYSPHHPPPSISKGEVSTITKSQSTASATTSSSLLASASKPNKVNLTATATDQSPEEVKRQVNLVKKLPSGEAKFVNQGADAMKTLISVVYGLKIEPKAGCGKLLFEPPNVIKGGANSTEMSSFLKKKWSEISATQKNGSNAFKTYSEDEENAVKQ